jgi:queuine tRNA-ribosyltransferase
MVLDVCPPLPSSPEVVRLAVERTVRWAERARAAHRRPGQSLFGIVQGGTDEALRVEGAHRTVALDFDGYAIGGLSVGETKAEMLPALAATIAHLPADRPRYLMGVGDPATLVEAIVLGADQFDCVMQTRLGRHGTALTSTGKVHIKAARHAAEHEPIDATCACAVCARHSRAYLRHLFAVGEPSAARLVSLHNVAWTVQLMDRIRSAIVAGNLAPLRRDVLNVWAGPSVVLPAGSEPSGPDRNTERR